MPFAYIISFNPHNEAKEEQKDLMPGSSSLTQEKLRLRERKSFALSYTARKEQSKDRDPCLLILKPMFSLPFT